MRRFIGFIVTQIYLLISQCSAPFNPGESSLLLVDDYTINVVNQISRRSGLVRMALKNLAANKKRRNATDEVYRSSED
jgi:hypothetical protein